MGTIQTTRSWKDGALNALAIWVLLGAAAKFVASLVIIVIFYDMTTYDVLGQPTTNDVGMWRANIAFYARDSIMWALVAGLLCIVNLSVFESTDKRTAINSAGFALLVTAIVNMDLFMSVTFFWWRPEIASRFLSSYLGVAAPSAIVAGFVCYLRINRARA